MFEYGPRVGCWRLLRIFKRFDVKISMLGVVRGMLMYPELTRSFVEEGHEVVSHGWRWLDYCQMSEAEEREHVRLAVRGIKKLTGAPPVGWFSGRSSVNTRRLLVEHGGFLYDRDYFGDELLFWIKFGAHNHLVVPYSLETNDNRFDRNTGFSTAEEFAQYMIDCFDLMYEEGAERPKIISSCAARSPYRPAGQGGRTDQIPRLCAQARSRMVLHRPRHCGTLAPGASAVG